MATRRLSPEERALWKRVAGSVRALKPVDDEACPSVTAVRAEQTRAIDSGRINVSTSIGKNGSGRSVAANTLDGSWDKRLGGGSVVPDRTIDLHGFTLSGAHHRLDRGLDEAIRDGARVILLITGKGPSTRSSRIDLPLRGIIRASIGDWLAASRHARSIAAVRNAHPRHGGAGALYLILRRPR